MDIEQTTDELDRIIFGESLTPFFQPIVSTQQSKIYGYEALIRGPSVSPLHSPLNLFQAAAQCHRLVEVDMLARKLAIRHFRRLGLSGKLFLNVMPHTLFETNFREGKTLEYLREEGVDPSRVVIEITEQMPIHDYSMMRHALCHYREMGFKVALDDLGDGSAGLRHWAELSPDYVKTTRYFCQQIDNDPAKHKFMDFLMEVSRSLGCEVIIEGVERMEEYRCLWGLKSDLQQGYYFSPPAANPPREITHVRLGNDNGLVVNGFHTAMAICLPREPITVDAQIYEVMTRLREQPSIRSIAVTEGQIPVGVINRDDLLDKFSNPYAHALYGKKKAQELCRQEMFLVREDTGLEDLSRQLTEHTDEVVDELVVVDGRGCYLGIARVMDLLREITTLQVKNARQANPLTGLPGNLIINNVLARSLESRRSFVAVYCDLDNFKPFNDEYGHAEGDEVIIALAELLRRHASGQEDFVGHVGGDDFMMVMMDMERWRSVCEAVLEDFRHLVPTFYSSKHRELGGMWVMDRQGNEVFCPLLSVSMAALPVVPECHNSPHELSAILSEVKQQAKQMPGNVLFTDRRSYHNDQGAELAGCAAAIMDESGGGAGLVAFPE